MGASASTPRKLFRPWKNKLLNVEKDLLTSDLFGGICAQLTLANSQSRGSLSRRDGDAVEDDEQRLVAKKEGLLSSKLLRGLFGDVTMQCVKDVPGDSISKEAFICILALCYEGNTEDRISYIFTMYNITLTGENNNEEGHVAEKDYLYLLNYLEEYMPLPKQLYAAFEECVIPMGGLLSNSQFVAWVRKYPDVMHFLAVHLPPSQPPMNPLTIRTNEDVLAGSDPLNNSPSCRNDSNRNSFGSFDFIGGEDSGDEDSDGLYDSDQLTEMELSQSSFRDSTTSLASNDELTSILKEAGAVVQDDRTNVRAMGRSPNRDQGDQQTKRPTEPEKQYLQQDQQQDQQQIQSQEQQQALLYLNESHPWYRGAMDLNMDNVSLLFERTLARNAPTRYFFQVSTLALHEMDSKRGVQYKLCADTEVDFDRWTSAIAEVVNRKDTQNAMASGGAPVLTHQQLYRQRLMEQRAAAQADQAREHESARDTDIEKHKDDADPEKTSPFYGAENEQGEQVAKASTDVSSSHSKRKAPPRIVTELPIPSSGGLPVPSCWHLHIHVDGSKQCLIVGFMLNIVAIRCLASEHVIWKIVVCIAVTGIFIFNVYNPRSLQRPIRGGLRGRISSGNNIDPSVLGTELAQCHDPDNCCLHKLGNASSNGCSDGGEGDASSAEGAGDVPHRKFSGQSMRRFAKFSMGSTMVRSDMQPDGRSSNVDHSWSTTRAETFSVRSADYKKLRRKEASQPALFEFLGADLVRTDSKVDLISQRVEFPPEYENAKLFIINAQLPSYGPSVWGDGSCDGPGYSLALYWMIPDDVYEELQNPTTTTLRLLKRFLEAGDDRSLTDRFKVIAQVTNQDECGMTGMAKKLLVSHNATPVLTRPQHRIYHFREGSTEVVVDVHAFSYIARRGIHLLIDKTSKLVIDVAFVIQGETEDELPEQVLGCCRLDHTSVQKAAELP
ncbi:hypothetical protein PHYBOEH_005660 [Phytophthora boehmeriae]|uniref:Protein ENHANCED DISEASE RESISTANCE 2 C-terminal domain-containing protein n=1 Tax=Phytophthora boehmeriae TaxID=109152 RepID=A0A8T1WLD7_9STRA|nr:hypothetical protein PHYBOEH_005660 [Phytophthora boehmeriae]